MPRRYASMRERLNANSTEVRCHDSNPKFEWTKRPCRIWCGRLGGSRGYGRITIRTRRRHQRTRHRLARVYYAHRLSLALYLGIPIWMLNHVHHLCDNPPCIEPTHLRSSTQLKNLADMMAKGRHRNGKTGPLPEWSRIP